MEVDAGVAAGGPQAAAGLVAGGDVGAGDGGDEGVEALALGLAGGALLGLALLLGLPSASGLGLRLASAAFFLAASAFACAAAALASACFWRRPARRSGRRASSPMTTACVRPVSLGGCLVRGGSAGEARSADDAGGGEGGDAGDVARSCASCGSGRRCFPVARVNAMAGWSFPSFSPTGLADGFGAGRSPTGSLAARASDSPQGLRGSPAPLARADGDSAMTVRCRGCGVLLTNSRTDAKRDIFRSPNRTGFLCARHRTDTQPRCIPDITGTRGRQRHGIPYRPDRSPGPAGPLPSARSVSR